MINAWSVTLNKVNKHAVHSVCKKPLAPCFSNHALSNALLARRLTLAYFITSKPIATVIFN